MHIRVIVASAGFPNVPSAIHARAIVEAIEPRCLACRRFRPLHTAMMIQKFFQPHWNGNSFCEGAVALLESHHLAKWIQTVAHFGKDFRNGIGRMLYALQTGEFAWR